MINWILNARLNQLGTAGLVVLTGAVVGREAAAGMSRAQWAAAVIALVAAIAAATLAHVRQA